jgi:hypothetical protein
VDQAPFVKSVARNLNGHAVDGRRLEVSRDGIRFDIELVLQKASWDVRVSCPLRVGADTAGNAVHDGHGAVVHGRPNLTLVLEDGICRLGTRLGLNLKVATGDQEFDRLVYVHGHGPAQVLSQVLSAPRARRAILQLLGSEWPAVSIDARRARLVLKTRVGFQRSAELVPLVAGAMDELATLANALPVFAGLRVWRARIIDVVSPVLGFATLLGGALLSVWGAHDFQTEDGMVPFSWAARGLSVWPIVALAAYFACRKGVEGLSSWAFCMLPMLVGLPLVFAGGTLVYNGLGDPGSPSSASARIVNMETHRGSKKTSYLLYTTDYRSPGSAVPLELGVDHDEYQRAHVGDRVEFTFKPGRLGHRWLQSMRVRAGSR